MKFCKDELVRYQFNVGDRPLKIITPYQDTKCDALPEKLSWMHYACSVRPKTSTSAICEHEGDLARVFFLNRRGEMIKADYFGQEYPWLLLGYSDEWEQGRVDFKFIEHSEAPSIDAPSNDMQDAAAYCIQALRKSFKKENKYTVIKNSDIVRYLPKRGKSSLEICLNTIHHGRMVDGRPKNSYVVVNEDMACADEVWKLIEEELNAKA